MAYDAASSSFEWLLQTPARTQWQKVGIHKRSGLATPLFSIYSKNSVGIGELNDLKLLIDWCRESGLQIIQLLPVNDIGFNFTPYDAQSSFALEPMYLTLSALQGCSSDGIKTKLAALRKKIPAGRSRVNYQIKREKLKLLQIQFKHFSAEAGASFAKFKKQNSFWLHDYALYKVIKANNDEKPWWEWESRLARHEPDALHLIESKYPEAIEFQKWLQWQLAEQFGGIKKYAKSRKILLMGDLPFLVSKDSADVWTWQHYFKLDLLAGAPPDMYFAEGQRWGMPPYQWETIAGHQYDYLIRKLQYAEHFYDMYRIDHFVGLFRIWTMPLSSNSESATQPGQFDPIDENIWEQHGKKILDVMLAATSMLPCAEDLGTVPPCSYVTIREYGVTGMDVLRWLRDWERTYDFKPINQFRPNAIAVLSTHDSTDLRTWWEMEAGTVDESVFRKKCLQKGMNADALITEFFNREQCYPGRLRWKPGLSLDQFLWSLGKPRDEVKELVGMYLETAGEKEQFLSYIQMSKSEDVERLSMGLAEQALEQINRSTSIFSIQLLQDWLYMSDLLVDTDPREFRINTPGTMGLQNWSLVMPFALETLRDHPVTKQLKQLNKRTGRIG